ncbi:MAG: Ig domain-containing protein, partial [Wujia sp.]
MMKAFKRVIAFIMTVMLIVGSVSVTGYAAEKKTVKSVKITNVSTSSLVLKKGKTFKLKTKVEVTGKASKKVSYSSSNTKVATVSSTGKIKAVKNGTAKITVKSTLNNKKKATIKVIVGTPVTKVSMNKTKQAYVGDKFTLKVTVTPNKPSIKKLSYTSSNKNLATVSSKGVVTCKKAGTVTITAKATDGSNKKASCKVTIKKKSSTTTQAPVQPSAQPSTQP